MHKVYQVIIGAVFIITVQSCSKKTYPTSTTSTPASTSTSTSTSKPISTIINTDVKNDTSLAVKKPDSVMATKPVIKRKPKEPIPKVIVVNDKYANKSVDGRYYYDLQGHRYWRSNKDGKYYLFNKSMLTDDAFKKPD